MKNVADTLRTPTRRWAWVGGSVAAAGLVVAAAIMGPSFSAQLNPAPRPTASVGLIDTATTLTPDELAQVQGIADTQQTKIADDAKAAAQAAAEKAATLSAGHQQQTEGGPIKCDAGYIANAVDDQGNESNCQPTGPGGRPCVAYDATNNCTQYYKP